MLGLGLGLTNFGTRGGVSDVPDALSGASSLLDGEDGLAIAFEDQSIAIRDTTTPANNISSAGTVRNGALVGPGAKIIYTSPSPKLVKKQDGTYGYRAQNLYLNSEAPANQSITVVSGLPYIINVTGTVSITLSGAATGTVTAGNPITFTAATGTLTCGSTSGAGTVHLRSTIAAPDYIKTTSTPLYDLPYDWTGTYYYPLCEPAATNICLYSIDLTQSNWTKTSATAAKTATGPDGVANSASTLTASAANGTAIQKIVSASAARSGSVFLKRRTGTGAVTIAIGETTGSELLTNGDFAAGFGTGWANISTGTGTASIGSGQLTIVSASTGNIGSATQSVSGLTVGKIYRFSVECVSGSIGQLRVGTTSGGNETVFETTVSAAAQQGVQFRATATSHYVTLQTNLATGTVIYDNASLKEVSETTVDLSSGAWVRPAIENKTITNPCIAIKLATSGDAVDVAYAQMETGTVATSPIITAGATVTRAADALSELLSTIPSLGSAYTLAVKYRPRSAAIENRALRIDDGTANEVVAIGNTSGGNGSAWVVDGGSAQTAPLTDGAVTSGASNRIAVSVEANNIRMSVNGAAVVSDTSATLPSPTTLRFMPVGAGHIESLIVLPHATSDDTALRGLLA